MKELNITEYPAHEVRVFEMLVDAQPIEGIATQLGIELADVQAIREQLVEKLSAVNESVLSYVADHSR